MSDNNSAWMRHLAIERPTQWTDAWTSADWVVLGFVILIAAVVLYIVVRLGVGDGIRAARRRRQEEATQASAVE